MAREHARILCSIWRPGDDFRDRSPEAQRLYFLLLSQRELNNAGVMPLMLTKWARCSAGTTTADVEAALTELVEHRYVLVDHDTEELLVRTFVRNDGILKHPYTRRSALRSAEQIESRRLRSELARELVLIGDPEGIATASRLDPDAVPSTRRDAFRSGTSTTHRDAIESGTRTTHRDGIESGTSTTHGGGEGVGEGGGVPVPENLGGGGKTIKPPPPNLDPLNPRCTRHRDIPADDPGPNCRQCRDARLDVERLAESGVLDDRAVRDAWRAAVDDCDECDHNGKLELPDGSLRRHHDDTEAAS